MNLTVELAPISREDLPKLMAWRNDFRLMAWTRQSDMLNEVEHADWYERQARDPATRMYLLVVKTDGRTETVGVCGLTSIDYRNSRAEFSCYVAPAFQRKGIGRHALQVLFTHGFANLGIRLIYGETFQGNPAAKIFEALGMTKEGTRRGYYWKDGNFIDAHLYSITREEWYGRLAQDNAAGAGTRADGLAPPERAAGGNDPTPIGRKRRRRASHIRPSPVEALCNPPSGGGAA